MSRNNRIIIPCRLAYLNCWRPASQNGKEEKFSLSALIPKEDVKTIKLINDTIEEVKNKSGETWGGKIPNNLKLPFHDGDTERADNPIYRNCMYLNPKSNQAPQIVDYSCHEITNQSELYSGCYANISIVFQAYNFSGSKGIAVWLGNIQKVRDGEPLGGRVFATQEFQPIQLDEFLQ